MKKIFLVAVAMLALSSNAFAESKGGGGGDAVKVGQSWGLLDLNEQLPFKYFNPLADGIWKNAAHAEAENAVNAAMLCTGELPLGSDIPKIYRALGYVLEADLFDSQLTRRIYPDAQIRIKSATGGPLVWVRTDTPLTEIPDEGIIRLIEPATKQQVAVQKDGVVMVYGPIFDKLNAKNKAALVLHEEILHIVLASGSRQIRTHGTQKIRTLVNYLFSFDPSMPMAAWEKICGPTSDFFRTL